MVVALVEVVVMEVVMVVVVVVMVVVVVVLRLERLLCVINAAQAQPAWNSGRDVSQVTLLAGEIHRRSSFDYSILGKGPDKSFNVPLLTLDKTKPWFSLASYGRLARFCASFPYVTFLTDREFHTAGISFWV